MAVLEDQGDGFLTKEGCILAQYADDDEDVVIPDRITKIAAEAFFNKKVKTLTLSKNMTSINGSAFFLCKDLEKVIVPEENPYLKVVDNCVIDTEKKTLLFGLKNSVIPSDGSVVKIGSEAFSLNGLDNFFLPDCITEIGSYAFSGCEMKSVVLPKGLKKLGSGAFSFCEFLETVVINDGLRAIGNKAFTHSGIISIKIPDSVTSIGNEAFGMCEYLEDAELPKKLKKLGELAFDGCKNIKGRLFIPKTLESDLQYLFSSGNLDEITVEDGNPNYISKGNCLIERETKTLICGCKNSVIPDDGSVKFIGGCAFDGCRGLKNIVIPDGVENIGGSAFAHCEELESVVIPNTVTEIKNGAFWYCSSLKQATLPKRFAGRKEIFDDRYKTDFVTI